VYRGGTVELGVGRGLVAELMRSARTNPTARGPCAAARDRSLMLVANERRCREMLRRLVGICPYSAAYHVRAPPLG